MCDWDQWWRLPTETAVWISWTFSGKTKTSLYLVCDQLTKISGIDIFANPSIPGPQPPAFILWWQLELMKLLIEIWMSPHQFMSDCRQSVSDCLLGLTHTDQTRDKLGLEALPSPTLVTDQVGSGDCVTRKLGNPQAQLNATIKILLQ